MKQLNVRIADDLDKRIRVESKVRKLSRTDLTAQAIDHFLTCKKTQKEPSLRQVINAYASCYCDQCSQLIPLGEPCLWGKNEYGGTVYLCLACQSLKTGDKTLIKLDQKRRKLERLIQSYRNELDRIASQFEGLELFQKEQETLNVLTAMNRSFIDLQSTIEYNKAVKGSLSIPELEGKIDELIRFSRDAMTYLRDFESFREKYLKVRSTQKEKVRA